LCDEILGKGRWAAASCSHDKVGSYYAAADYFVLASLKEGFGRVFLEASSYGLQCIAHDDPVMRYVLGSEGLFSDMRQSGTLCQLIRDYQNSGADDLPRRRNRVKVVENRFSWEALREQYIKMFKSAAGTVDRVV
jgi:glycosyltransferase involved in cell wall biosynthesis